MDSTAGSTIGLVVGSVYHLSIQSGIFAPHNFSQTKDSRLLSTSYKMRIIWVRGDSRVW